MNNLEFVQVPKGEFFKEIESLIYRALENIKTQQPEKEKELYTRQEVAMLLKVSYPTLFNWNKNKILVSKKIGSRVYYAKSDVMTFFNKK
ncbi:hypothetical protein J2X97_002513 [Epilithonimonas hungarica]|uniref:helix-turn-helix domain-containing protein n=1 Tax=Epilithonimonas hungarica TaxID=454006 RepID=UPI002786F4BB|nr:helix-turn-helix domain-containing protein [Epilithonimonas hungarica]MDP9956854.1 hypothetical protein [Epilithonimonas hungarica]